MEDLWPNDIVFTDTRAPVTILREQARLLGDRTKNIVTATVESHNISSDRLLMHPAKMPFNHHFWIVSSPLSYRYRLFSMLHDIPLYPVYFELDQDIANELLYTNESDIKIDDEAKLLALLKNIFGATKTRQVVSTIVAQTRG